MRDDDAPATSRVNAQSYWPLLQDPRTVEIEPKRTRIVGNDSRLGHVQQIPPSGARNIKESLLQDSWSEPGEHAARGCSVGGLAGDDWSDRRKRA